jgi:hypothetical protein
MSIPEPVAMTNLTKQDYIRKVLDAYRLTPGTDGRIRRNDRSLAAALYDRGVSVTAVENALLLAASRRIFRSPTAAPLQPIRSLHYFLPAIDEILETQVGQGFFAYLRFHIERLKKTQ